ncbi:MAG: hypothetical protein IPM66_20045 [Acidobacteriota bacterium]|nr:MAG: hypothetical protein IPM66_20045 [Acidobacteriota bacterium]
MNKVILWGARSLSVLIILFWGYFILGHLLGDAGSPSRPLTTADYLGITALVVSLVGLAAAWKWELAGSLVTLGAVLIGALVNWRVLIFPGTLIPITALLFLLVWWKNRTGQSEPGAHVITG